MKPMQLENFIESLFKSVGGIVTVFGDYNEVDLPEELAEKLGSKNPYRYSLNPEIAQHSSEIAYINRGTPAFKKILQVIGQTGMVTRGYYPFPKEKSNGPASLKTFLEGKGFEGAVIQSSREVYLPKIEIQYHLKVESSQSKSLISKEFFDVLDITPIESLPLPTNQGKKEKMDKKIEEVFLQENVIPVFLRVLKTIETRVKVQVEANYSTNKTEFEEDKKIVNKFYELVKEELEDKKECLYYHLYFFQKEEKINKLIIEQEEEWDLKLKINQLKYRFQAFLDIFNGYIHFYPGEEHTILLPGKEKSQKIYYDHYMEKVILPKTALSRKKGKKVLKKTA